VSYRSGSKWDMRTAQASIEVANSCDLLRIRMYMDVEFTSARGVGPVVRVGGDSLNWSVPVASLYQRLGDWGFRPQQLGISAFKLVHPERGKGKLPCFRTSIGPAFTIRPER
jgi:hypothetical protein